MSHNIVRHDQAAIGERGERLLVRGDTAHLRLWEHEPAGETAPGSATVVEAEGAPASP